MPDPLEIKGSNLVIVEGQDEVRLFNSLPTHLSIPDVQVEEYGGYPKLKPFLKTLKAMSGFGLVQSLAVVADGNSSSINRDKSIRGTLSAMELPCPSGPLEVASHGNLKVAYLIVPHGQDTGMIEDVCLSSVSADPAMECIERYFECISHTDLPGPKEVRMSKARVHAFLASRERPELRLGEAAESGIWQFDADAFQPLRELLTIFHSQ